MKDTINLKLLESAAVVAFSLLVWTGGVMPQTKKEGKQLRIDLPAAVAKAVQDNRPGAEIEKLEVEEEAGITVYDLEFKANQGEMDVTKEGVVLDVATVVDMERIPKAAAETLKKAAKGAHITQLEKSEVRAEIEKHDGKVKVAKLVSPRYVYEAELAEGEKTGEIEVRGDGTVISPLKWNGPGRKEKEQK